MTDFRPTLVAAARDAKRMGDGQVTSMLPMLGAEFDSSRGGGMVVVGLHGEIDDAEVADVARKIGGHWYCRAVTFTSDALLSNDTEIDMGTDFSQNPASEVRRSVLVVRIERGGRMEMAEIPYRYDDRACAVWGDEPSWEERTVVTQSSLYEACRAVFEVPTDSLPEGEVIAWVTQRGHVMMVAS